MSKRSIRVLATSGDVVSAAAERIVVAARNAISRDGKFSIALCSGETANLVHELLASEEFTPRFDWPNWHVYFTDKKCIPPARPGSNFRAISEALLDQTLLAPEHIHRMKGEIEPQQAAIEYGRLLKQNFVESGPDVVLLELGAAGEIAGLFPRTAALDETHHRCMENDIPGLNEWRITMTAPFINRAALVILMAAGADKAPAVAEALEGNLDPRNSPAQIIAPDSGELIWLMDADAAGMNVEDWH